MKSISDNYVILTLTVRDSIIISQIPDKEYPGYKFTVFLEKKIL